MQMDICLHLATNMDYMCRQVHSAVSTAGESDGHLRWGRVYLTPWPLGLTLVMQVGSVGKGILFVKESTSDRERFLAMRESAGFEIPLDIFPIGHKTTRAHSALFTCAVNLAEACSIHIAVNCECSQLGSLPFGFVVNCCCITSIQVLKLYLTV